MKEIILDFIIRFLDLACFFYTKVLIAVFTTTVFLMVIFGYDFSLTIHFSSAKLLWQAIKNYFKF